MRSNASTPFSRLLAALASLLMAALFVGVYSKLAGAADLNIDIDQAELIRLDKPGAEIIIGNPTIADVTVQSSRLLILTGKSIGLTNLIVLDGNGEAVYRKKVHVGSDEINLVTVSRGKSRETYSCSPNCTPALMPGDTVTFFDPLSKSIRSKLGLAQSAAEGTSAQQ
jgi:hypothetical protein